MNMNFKQGAMFGLDARIALAIFGALSVISGAALYSAIQNAKVTAIYTSSQEVIKAFEQLYLDTSRLRLYKGDANACFNAEDLITNNSMAGWKGPYLSMAGTSSDGNIDDCLVLNDLSGFNDFSSIRIRHLKNTTWDLSPVAWWNNLPCNSSGDCSLFMNLTASLSKKSLITQLDSQLDDSNAETGNIRYKESTNIYLYIKGFNYN